MTLTEERFSSIDLQLAAARAAWEGEKKSLTEQILQLETELGIHKALHEVAIKDKDLAMQTTAKLLAQFGVVATVFAEARELAISAGLYKGSSEKVAGVVNNMEKIDLATGTSPATNGDHT